MLLATLRNKIELLLHHNRNHLIDMLPNLLILALLGALLLGLALVLRLGLSRKRVLP